MLSRPCRRALNGARRAAESGRRRRLRHSPLLDESSAMPIVRMARRFIHAEHRRETNVAALHDLAPLVARFAAEQRLQPLLHRGPRLAILLMRQLLALEARQPEQFLVELCLDRSDRDVLAVPGFVNLVIMSARVEDVLAALVVPYARTVHPVGRGHQ